LNITPLAPAMEVLSSESGPLTAKKLQQKMRARYRIAPADVTAALTELVQNQTVHVWPAFRSSAARYWHCDANSYIRERIFEIASSVALPRKHLEIRAARLSHCTRARVEKTLNELIREGRIVKARTVGRSALLFASGATQALIASSLDLLKERLLRTGLSEEEIRAAGFGAESRETSAPPDIERRILDGLRDLQPTPGGPVTARALRARLADVSKPEFDQAIMKLADQQRVYVIRHDHGGALAEAEQQQLINDGGTNLYVAVALRG
jgi:hypothetical protein